jgi:hypothetical protein
MGWRRTSEGEDEARRGYRRRLPGAPDGRDEVEVEVEDLEASAALDDDDDDYAEDDEDGADEAEFEEDLDERPSEFWHGAELLRGATVEDAELELSYAASVYADLPAAELRLWLRLPDGTRRLVQIDEPHAVWLYRGARGADDREFEEYPDQRFELLCTDVRAMRARRQRQLIDEQARLHEELVAAGEELEELERDAREDEEATAAWPGTRWPE